ncbi:CHASE4 domain-containing protein [Chloroflexota bacterium]
MTLRKKILLIISVVLISTICLVYLISRLTLIEDIEDIEEFTTHQNVERALGALYYVIADLETTTSDWASWDDTYAFIEDANDEYIQSNLIDDTFITLKLNLMLFINSSGQTIFGKAFDLYNEEEGPVPQGLRGSLSENGLLPGHPGTESSTSGILVLEEGPMLVTLQPILTSQEEGPIRGTVIFGRYLDSMVIDRLTQITLYPITVHSPDDLQTYPDSQKAVTALLSGTPVFVQPLSTQQVAGYTLIKDIYGNPALVLRISVPRDIYMLGQTSVAYLILSILGIGLCIAAAAMLFINKQVLSRFTSLIKGIENITRSGDMSTRLSVTGNDELTMVADTINGMIVTLQESEGELKELYQQEKDLRHNLEEEAKKRVEFTRALVHELKTPITPVLAASELLLEEVNEEHLTKLVESINRGASNLNRRIDELLDLARGEIDTLQLNLESIDPIPLLQEIGYEMIPITLRDRQSLNLDLPSSLPLVWADRERVQQIVMNMLTNASKFTPAGGSIILKARGDDANLIVEVHDTGPGISEEDQERLFNPYSRLIGDRERLSGLGLGLALCKTLVELHGGQIWVKSEKDKGSTFGFSLPLKAASQKEG